MGKLRLPWVKGRMRLLIKAERAQALACYRTPCAARMYLHTARQPDTSAAPAVALLLPVYCSSLPGTSKRLGVCPLLPDRRRPCACLSVLKPLERNSACTHPFCPALPRSTASDTLLPAHGLHCSAQRVRSDSRPPLTILLGWCRGCQPSQPAVALQLGWVVCYKANSWPEPMPCNPVPKGKGMCINGHATA